MPDFDPSPKPSLARRLALVAFGLLLGLGLAEVALRLFGLAPEVALVRQGRFQRSANPRLGYEPVPHFENTGAVDTFHDFAGKSNRLGFRDREHPVEKPPGTLRLLVLGDSIAVGQGIRDGTEIFPAILERDLRASGLPVEVMNFAVSGYNTRQEVETLKTRGLAFAPDWVLLAYCLNDTRQDDGGVLAGLDAQAGDSSPRRARRIHPQLAASAVYRLLWYALAPKEPPSELSGDTVDAAFDELGELSRRHGFRVLVVVFPRFGGLSERYRYADQHALPAAAAERNGFAHLDLLAAFQACRATADGSLARDRYHPTVRGHRCAAGAIGGFLAAQLR